MRLSELTVALLLMLSACASPEQRIASKLISYGIAPDVAQCLADRLESRLSRRQLQALAGVARDIAREREGRRMTVAELLDQVRRLDDPEIVAVLTRAGIGCAVLRS